MASTTDHITLSNPQAFRADVLAYVRSRDRLKSHAPRSEIITAMRPKWGDVYGDKLLNRVDVALIRLREAGIVETSARGWCLTFLARVTEVHKNAPIAPTDMKQPPRRARPRQLDPDARMVRVSVELRACRTLLRDAASRLSRVRW